MSHSSGTPGTPGTPSTPDNSVSSGDSGESDRSGSPGASSPSAGPGASRTLPPRPHLDQYRTQAKELRDAAHRGDPQALARLQAHLPPQRLAQQTPFTLADAQLAIAREHGFPSWPRFKRHLETQRTATPPSPEAASPAAAIPPQDLARVFPSKEADAATFGVCLVPGIGIRPAGNPGLVASHPVTVTHGTISATVTQLFSGGGETDLRLDVTGVTPDADGRVPGIPIALANAAGGVPGAPIRRVWRTTADGNGLARVSVDAAYPALPGDAREALLELSGPPPLDGLVMTVPVAPVHQASLHLGRAAGGRVPHHGVSVRATWVVPDPDARQVTVQLVGEAAPPFRGVGGLGWRARPARLLRAADGREFAEVPGPPPLNSSGGRQYTDHVTFQGVPGDVDLERAHVLLPHVSVEDAAARFTFRVSLDGLDIGDRVPLERDVTLGAHVVRILGAEIAPPPPAQPGRAAPVVARQYLLLHVDCGSAAESPRFVGPGLVSTYVPGQDDFRRAASFTLHGSQPLTQLRVELPGPPLSQVDLTFSSPMLALDGPEGPWEIPLANVTTAHPDAPLAAAPVPPAGPTRPVGPLPEPNESTRQALSLAGQEAGRLGHTYVGTEHLLLGILRFDGSTAVRLLRTLGAEPARIRTAVEHVLSEAASPPVPVTTQPPPVQAPADAILTPRSHRVLALAASAAYHLDRAAVGTEHLLLGLVLEHDGIAAGILRSFGVTVDTLRPRITALPYGSTG